MTVRLWHLTALASILALTDRPVPLHASAQPAPVSPPAVAVDVTVTHGLVNADGTEAGPPSRPTTFSLVRRHTASGWTTVLTYRPIPGASTDRALATPLDGARLEYDDGAGGVRVYDQDGRLNERLSQDGDSAGLPVFDGAAQWLDALLVDPRQGDDRRRALRRAFGAPVGRVRGLDRHVSRDGDTVSEVLADPRSGVVMERNVARGGALRERVQFEYATRPDGSLFRHTIRTEHASEGDGQGRAVLTVVFSNLSVDAAR